MDPNTNLNEQRQLVKNIKAMIVDGRQTSVEYQEDTARLAELVQALDQWLVQGGFLPATWNGDR